MMSWKGMVALLVASLTVALTVGHLQGWDMCGIAARALSIC